ncbi:Protein of unknown function [Halpernia humi]|uniref:DUF2442 domain-containing protein n=1 Tax=Halpernia humi TaxID=493375 RepID=A0A1H5ZY39_9FLAO|nr:DUF2442 domain-containing protein [Halpernia humi]SEG41121.1 Protein of unknown function [Halpernia humi]
MSLIWITKAKYIENYKIEVFFNSDESKVIDLEEYLDKGIFLELRNKEYFKNFKINSWTIEWENGADFSPEFLYSLKNKSRMVH